MNILFIIPEYYPHSGGGISTYYLHYINAIKAYCKRVKVIVGSGYTQSSKKFNYNGIEVEYLNPVLYHKYQQKFTSYDALPEFKNNIAAAWAMWEQANYGEGFDIIECTEFGLGFIPWVINHHKPVITRLHGSTGQITLHENDNNDCLSTNAFMHAELELLPLSDCLITYSSANRDFWRSVLPAASIYYIPPVFQSDKKQIIPLAKRDGHGLVTARIQKWKGPVELCEAINAANLSFTIKWFGRDTVFNKKLTTGQYLIANYPGIWCKHILPQAPKPNTEIQAIQQTAKFGLVPSTWDMFNFTCLEFMVAGTPVICSIGAGVSELIEHGKNGYKYDPSDPHSLNNCIKTLSNLSSEDYGTIAQAGQTTITDKLSADTLMPQNIKYYEAAIKEFNPPASNIFLNKVYTPADNQHNITDILDKQPLKKLLKYITKRLLLKAAIK